MFYRNSITPRQNESIFCLTPYLWLFNNDVTLKLLFFDQPNPHHHASLRMITKPSLLYVTPDTNSPRLYHLFLFFEVEKKKKPRFLRNQAIFTKFNCFVLELFFIVGLGQNFTLENFQFGRFVLF